MVKAIWYSSLVIVIGVVFNLRASLLSAQEPYYKGKTVRIIVGFAAGGGVDAEARLLARYLERHTPGNPTVIAQNMAGAGGMVATNWFEQFAKPDGLTLHYTGTTSINQQVFAAEGMKFDLRNWPLVGSVFRQAPGGRLRAGKVPPPLKPP